MKTLSERDIDYLTSILDRCDRIAQLQERFGSSFEEFENDPAYIDAVMMNVFQIGELSNQLSEECRDILKEIPWRQISSMRDIITRAYVNVDKTIMWNIVVRDIPLLRKEINKKAGIL